MPRDQQYYHSLSEIVVFYLIMVLFHLLPIFNLERLIGYIPKNVCQCRAEKSTLSLIHLVTSQVEARSQVPPVLLGVIINNYLAYSEHYKI